MSWMWGDALPSWDLLIAQAAEPGGPFSLLGSPIVPILIIGLMFYLLLVRPEQRKRAEQGTMLTVLIARLVNAVLPGQTTLERRG